MSFNRYNQEDSVISAETVVRGAWSGDVYNLTSFYSSSVQTAESLKYYLNVYDTAATSSLQFAIQYGHVSGSGSVYFNPAVIGNTPSKDVYGQYRNLIYGDEGTNFTFNGTGSQDIFVINIARSRYKESIQPGSLSIILGTKTLIDDYTATATTNYLGSNRYYNIVASGSTSPVYGYLFPDIGTIILSPDQLNAGAGIALPTRTANTATTNLNILYAAIVSGASFRLQSQETVSSRFFFTRVKNQEFNYTTNPSIIDNQGNILYSTLINNPQTYITTVGLYNDNNELLAVAKLSKPLTKDFTKELLVRIKLDY